MLDRAINRILKWLENLIALMLSLMVILVFGNVVLRYGFNSGIGISEEVSRYLFVWMIFCGAIIAVREQAHLGVDALVRVLPKSGKRMCALASHLLMLYVMYLLFQGSWQQTLINYNSTSPVAGISMSVLYLPGIIASVAISILLLLRLYQMLFVGIKDENLLAKSEAEQAIETEHVETNSPGPSGGTLLTANAQSK